MKFWTVVLVVLFVSGFALAQERFLIGPFGDAIPIKKGESAIKILKEQAKKKGIGLESPLAACPSAVPVGYPYTGQVDVNFGFSNGDVAAMVFTAPLTGIIESLYFTSQGLVANPDSTAIIRIMGANTSGYAPDTVAHFGYWPDTNIVAPDTVPRTPYQDEATGPYESLFGENYPPVNGTELWGLGGYATTWHTGVTVTGVKMADLGYEPTINAGDSFAVCVRAPILPETGAGRNELSGLNPTVPWQFFKYYYHPRNTDVGSAGWWSREYDMLFWVVVRPAGNLPPLFDFVTNYGNHHTISQAARTVQAWGIDCNPGSPSDTGIVSMTLQYKVGGGSFIDVTMTNSGGVWSADIPAGLPIDSTITYHVHAVDNHGLFSDSPNRPYRIVRFSRDGYVTTFPTASFVDITSTGTQIPGEAYFGNAPAVDDGTAGPYSLGGSFHLFGQTVTHAWVGADGALGLGTSATDTVRVNAGGFYAGWTIPQGGIAKNFVSPFWNDLFLDSAGVPLPEPNYGIPGHGNAYYLASGNQFIVEYYHVGNFNSQSDTTTTFEVILDRSDSSVTFQYDNVGTTLLDSSALVGIQSDVPANGWVLVNRTGYPTQSRPAANFAIKLKLINPPGAVREAGGIPGKFALHTNYPNPFNPTTKITYDIPSRSRVELSIYNLLGEKVADVVSDVQDAGTYSATWDGRNLQGQLVSSGVYLYRLKAGNYLDTKKMVLLK